MNVAFVAGLKNYLNMEGFLEEKKHLKIKSAMKNAGKSHKGLEFQKSC